MRQQHRGRKREDACERRARAPMGQFLYVISFVPDLRLRGRQKRRTPTAPWRPPVVMRPSLPAAATKCDEHREDA
jgi:hypothetical protein